LIKYNWSLEFLSRWKQHCSQQTTPAAYFTASRNPKPKRNVKPYVELLSTFNMLPEGVKLE